MTLKKRAVQRYTSVGNSRLEPHENTLKGSAEVNGIISNSRVALQTRFDEDLEKPSFKTMETKSFNTLETKVKEASFSTRLIHGDDDRQIILETKYPYNIICLALIHSRFHRSVLKGTGFFISKRCVLTAGHCVFNDSEWMESIIVIPGALGDTAPFGQASSSKFRSVEGWTKDRQSNFDYGAIILENDTLYSNLNAHLGFSVSEKTNNIEIAGYPEDKIKMPHFARGVISSRSKYKFFYDIDTERGNSGSPIFHYGESNLQAIGIHTDGSNPKNYGIRFRSELLDRLNEWILL